MQEPMLAIGADLGASSAAITAWMQRALQRDPTRRWPDGAALAALEAAAEPILARTPVTAPPAHNRAPADGESARSVPLLWLQPFAVATGSSDLICVAEEAGADASIRLGEQRGLRLLDDDPLRRRLEGGEDADAITRSVGATLRAVVRVGRRREGLRAPVRLVTVDGGEIVGSAAIDVNDSDFERLGDTVAAHIVRAVGLQHLERHGDVSRVSIGDSLAVMAKRNLCSLDPAKLDVAAALLERALAPRPADTRLRVLRAWVLAQHWYASGSARPARLAELRAALPTLVAEPELPAEAQHALAQLLHLMGDAPAAARVARRGIAQAPSLQFSHELLGRLLLECGAGDEGLARLKAAARVAPLRLQAQLARCQWLALAGDWDRHDAELAAAHPEPGELTLLWTWQLRAAMWRDDRNALAALRDELSRRTGVNADDARVARVDAMVRAALGEGPCDVATRLTSQRAPLAAAEGFELSAELNAWHGQVDDALVAVAAAGGSGSHRLAWLDRCPLLAATRDSPGMWAVRTDFAARASAVRVALYDEETPA